MGLVDYGSDSDSDSAPPIQQQKFIAPATTTTTTKKPFQKLLDKGKIVVNLPTPSASASAADTPEDDQPPAKRAKTGNGGSRFSSFGSFLPPPKKTGAIATSSSRPTGSGSAPARGISLKTGAEPAFVRNNPSDNINWDEDEKDSAPKSSSTLNLPPPKKAPSIPEGQKPESEVKLVGKPLMFKPLSVTRRKTTTTVKKKATPTSSTTTSTSTPEPPKKQISLFSIEDDTFPTPAPPTTTSSTYEPIFSIDPTPEEPDNFTAPYPPPEPIQSQSQPQSLSSIADSLSASARRELFGRNSSSSEIPADAKIINFNMEQEYAHNQQLRASGEQQVYNPVRSIAPGKHSLRQVVNMAQNNIDALEESFAKGRNNKREAGGRYGW
ncbi:mitotic checkpoint regulator, MAD2B-interacting-domain-containing protein [Podospora fimiseda]|uniref:Mitotic checkpoint regulator, MAD2B-interacting-domain-containing protein n=1 Tax=Podospora fimiseda TaxID=252190 RepID=A0AAN7H306_9PEZI|nr:mitotic checkpoint regulator, MAD2B-interacting-domain-containing protein [Podospora fimiseda]